MGECRFGSKRLKARLVSDFLREFGDGLPESSIADAVSSKNLEHWHLLCDDKKPKQINSGVYWDQNDWYLCTMKNLATRPSERGKGLATKVVQRAFDQAARSPNCHVLAADITTTNIPSQRVFEKGGFSKVNDFCWQRGQKPANVLHYVRMRPKAGECK